MKRITTVSAIALLCSSICSFANESIVVGYFSERDNDSVQATANHTNLNVPVCVYVTGQQICIPAKPERKAKAIKVQGLSQKDLASLRAEEERINDIPDYVLIQLNDGIDPHAAIQAIKKTGRYAAVEINTLVSNGTPVPLANLSASAADYPDNDPNDKYFFEQKFYFGDSATNKVGLNIQAAWKQIVAKDEKIDVIVVDGGFHQRPDLEYFSGYRFATKDNTLRGPDFTQKGPCISDAHGTGVASVIGAGINNNLLITGAVQNVNIHAIQVLECGSGFYSDVADALFWLAGKEFEGIPAYIGGKGVINMSLGGPGECGWLHEQAVDAVINAGFSVVVAAGNDNVDASQRTPGSCKGVVTVGALHKDGNKASFSNYGEAVEISALGYDVSGLCDAENDACFWEGTSFAAPLVSSAIAMARKDAGMKAGVESLLLAVSSTKIPDSNGDCATFGCGKGMVNFEGLLSASKAIFAPEQEAKLGYALTPTSPCFQTWLDKSDLRSAVAACKKYKLSIPTMSGLNGVTYKLYGKYSSSYEFGYMFDVVAGDQLLTEEKIRAAAESAGTATLRDAPLDAHDYAYSICKEDICTVPVKLNSTGLAKEHKPQSCN